MKSFLFLFCVGLSAAALVKREADPEANPDADPEADPGLYRQHGGYASEPVCTLTPVKECKPRTVENPRQVCQTVIDIHEDTVVTENCEEVVTTQCTQTSQTVAHASAIVDKSTRLVETGVPRPIPVAAPVAVAHAHAPVVATVGHGNYGHGGAHYGKREAEAEPEADAEPGYGYGRGYAVAAPVAVHSAPAQSVSAPVCNSVPVKQCNKVPVSTPRKVARVVCDTIVDITTIEDCHETVTKTCQQTSTSHSSHSAVVGHDSKVIAQAVEVGHGHAVGGYAAVGHAVGGHAAVGHASGYVG